MVFKRILFLYVLCITVLFIFHSCSWKAGTKQGEAADTSMVKKTKKDVQPQPKEEDYFDKDYTRYENYIYDDDIHTVLLHRKGFELTYPFIQLNTEEKLKFSFDDFDDELKRYKYTVIHCNANWKPSQLQPFEYIDGFIEAYIEDYEGSFNTLQAYMHYEAVFPNRNFSITKAGNYILKVWAEGNKNQPIFTRRFMVHDPKVNIEANIKQPTVIDYRNYKQELDFNILTTGMYSIDNPYQNLKVVLRQNNRWDNAVYGLQPKFVKSNKLVYDYQDKNVFNGCNEFRNFDIKSLQYQSIQVKKIDYKTNEYHVYLLDDKRRPFQRYLSIEDINGRRLIKNEDANNPAIESEYAYVHFTLPYKNPLVDGALYVFGELTGWNFKEEAKMKYNFNKNAYEAKLYLKQGYYNYLYAFLGNNKSEGDLTLVEGNHYETENDYMILVYYREPGQLHDKLIGIKVINSVIDR